MKNMFNKKIDKQAMLRLIIVGIILLLDLTLLPWIIKFPIFLAKYQALAPQYWFSYGPLYAFIDLFKDVRSRNLYLVSQLLVFALVVFIAWNVDRLKKPNRIHDGLGGPEPAGYGEHGTSRWQNKDEMDKTALVWHSDDPINSGGIIFGMEKSKSGSEKVWLNNDDLHTLILGSTRSGKSRKIYLPSIWELAKSGESMVIGDPKGELFITSKDYLEKLDYKVIALNFREPLKGNQWNIMDLVNRAVDQDDIPKAAEIAWDIANTITRQKPATSSDPVWNDGEESTIASLILLTALNSEIKKQRHLSTVYYLIAEYGQPLCDETVPLIEYMKKLSVKHPAKAAFATASIAPYKMRTTFFTSALADLRLFADPNISDMTAKTDHDMESVGINKTAVFLIVPDEKQTRNVLATLYVDQLYMALVDLANKRGGRIPRRVNILLDEFGNLPAIPDFDKKLTVAAGRGIRFTIAVQDLQQIKKLYNKNSQTITGNCHNWIYLKTKDIETAKVISEMTGKYTVATNSSNFSLQKNSRSTSLGESLTGRALLLPDEVLRWDIDESLVFPMSYFPARYPLPDLSYWKTNTDFGFVKPSNNIEADKEKNRLLIENRWKTIPSRNIEDVILWFPDFDEIPATAFKSAEPTLPVKVIPSTEIKTEVNIAPETATKPEPKIVPIEVIEKENNIAQPANANDDVMDDL